VRMMLQLWSLVGTTLSTSLARWVGVGSTCLSVMLCICMQWSLMLVTHSIFMSQVGSHDGWSVVMSICACHLLTETRQLSLTRFSFPSEGLCKWRVA